ncbi:hypothetical protein Pmani_028573 [Petrolisthes manimaculis]|uniref:Ig-like domain-containing protein n=1 Tax=Petrolisthes manimaculis TaxID=1843537 RepID=A0AAE1P0Z1_9EUCA|nr:hypothetical protein Pmani_028573 [Petrolisthes manimaculis]
MTWVWVWVSLLLHHAQGVRVSRVSVPEPAAIVGEAATLRCHFTTPNDTFFSVRWYKDERQFYSFVPDRIPVKRTHYLPGLFVQVPESDEHVVQLRRVEVDNEGAYSCEVIGDKPFFKSSSSTANLSVALLPTTLVISGAEGQHSVHSLLNVTCTARDSWPRPNLTYFINGNPRKD